MSDETLHCSVRCSLDTQHEFLSGELDHINTCVSYTKCMYLLSRRFCLKTGSHFKGSVQEVADCSISCMAHIQNNFTALSEPASPAERQVWINALYKSG